MVLAGVLLAALTAQSVGSMRLKSVTYDEPIYLAAGWVATTTGIDLNPAHPPLMKYLIAAPLALAGSAPAAAIPNWDQAESNPRSYATSFLFENRADADTLLFAGRSAVVAVSVLLALVVWIWAWQLYGPLAATVSLGLYAFCPNIIAHSTLATLDLGVTAGIAVGSYAFWRAYRHPTPLAGIAAGAALATALLTKSSATVLLGLLPLQLGAAIVWHRRRRSADARALVVVTGVALLVAAAIIAVAYGPRTFGLAQYVAGFRLGVLDRDAFMNRKFQAFCWGRYSATGFPWYFLAAFVLKTPVPTLVATLASIVWLVRRGPSRLFDELFLVLPIVAFFVVTAISRDDLGLRYILPVYPLLYVLIGGMTVAVYRWSRERLGSRGWRSRLAAAGMGSLAAGYVAGTVAIYPDHLAFFNGLFCGPAEGIRYLDDSNIDWGQDFKQLARYMREHDITQVIGLYHPIYLAPYVARYYGVALAPLSFDEVRQPGRGWYAVSAHLLQRPYVATDPVPLRFDWLDRYTPVAKIGYSIYLYRFD